jgi:hypothetical protein
MLQKFVQGVQFVLEYEACFDTHRVFQGKVTRAIIWMIGEVTLFKRLNLRNMYYLFTNNNTEIYFSVLRATVVSSVNGTWV